MARLTSSAVGAILVTLLVTLLSGPALAEDKSSPTLDPRNLVIEGGPRALVVTPPEMFTGVQAKNISPIIYVNRCTGGCLVKEGGINDARADTSTIPKCASSNSGCVIAEYRDASGNTGSAADAEWNQLMTCMREVYSPFNVMITDQRPEGVSYSMAIVAGSPGNIGLANDILGVAPFAGDCSPQDNVMSFSFANHHSNTNRVMNLCWTAAQETAHALGLDHSWMFSDGTSACNDPLTYRTDCMAGGGQRFFRNKPASCGDYGPMPCRCGGSQNSHAKIRSAFGDGTSLIPPPTVVVSVPANGGTAIQGQVVALQAGSRRGVEKVELWLNGYKWDTVPGAPFGSMGQQNPAPYSLRFPQSVPDGVIDILVRVHDDIGGVTDAQTITVTKGAPCTSADSCLKGQKCEAGKCFWDPPTGQLGDACEYPQFCESGLCQGTAEQQICTTECIVGATGTCADGFQCVPTGGATGVCFFDGDGGGCCSVGSGPNTAWVHFGASALVLGFVLRRRRRRS
jgi:hypothetical protein